MIECVIEKARSDFDELANGCIHNNDVYNIKTSDGSVVLMSEQNYKNIIESLYLAGIKGVYEDVEEVINTPTEEFIKESPIE